MIKQSQTAVSAGLVSLALAGCIPPAPEPTPSPSPSPSAVPEPEPTGPVVSEVVTPTYDNWMDARATSGDWFYSTSGGVSRAVFGASSNAPLFAISCDRRAIVLSRMSTAQIPTPAGMNIRTETRDRSFAATPDATGMTISTTLDARDDFLDAMAFSRGRFAVETMGIANLYIPAWPEITRVIEDCR